MKHITKLPEAELEVMIAIWNANRPVTSDDILEGLKPDKTWQRTTVLKFLSRLADRGYLTVQKQGRFNLYTPAVLEKDYLESASKCFLEKLYHNSVKNLVASLYHSNNISKDDLQELKQFIEEAE